MSENGDLKDDVKIPDGEIGEKIIRLFREEEKDTSEFFEISVYILEIYADNPLPDVIILTAMGEETAIEAKEAPKQG